jgi:hypothetical protein
MERSLPPRPRPISRWLGRLTAATLGAASIGAAPPDVDDDPPGSIVPDHPDDDDLDPRHVAAAHWLAVSLERMLPLAATNTACRWALSPDPELRATMAGALEWTFTLLGDRTIIEHLAHDPEPAVRAAAARAAWARHARGSADAVLARLAADEDPQVREIAQLAMRGR